MVWPVTSSYEYRLWVFKNKADGNIRTLEGCSNKRLKKVHNEEFLNIYIAICTKKIFFEDKIKGDGMGGHVAYWGKR